MKPVVYALAHVVLATSAAALMFMTPLAVAVPTLSWTRVQDLSTTQSAAGAAIVDGNVFMAGGANPSGPPELKNVQVFNTSTGTWGAAPDMSARRYWPGAKAITYNGQSELYVIGGYNGYNGLSTVERYTPSSGTWSSAASLSSPRGHGVNTAVVNNNLYAIGGATNYTGYTTTEAYDRASNTWISQTSMPFSLQGSATAVNNGNIYLFGGQYNVTNVTSKCLMYNPTSDVWTQLPDAPRGRYFGAALSFGDYIYLVGGADGSNIIDVFNTASGSWESTTFLYPGSNTYTPCYAQGGNVAYLIGDNYGVAGQREVWVATPEPASLCLVTLGGLALIRRKG